MTSPTTPRPDEVGRASDYIVSLIRTIVPVMVGSLLAWLSSFGLEFDSTAVVGAVTGLAIVGYYAAARWLERRHPAAGVLLGARTQPAYGPSSRSAMAGMTGTWQPPDGPARPIAIVDSPRPGAYIVRTSDTDQLATVPADQIRLRGEP